MAAPDILPFNKHLEFHAHENLASAEAKLTEIYDDHQSFVELRHELDNPIFFHNYAASLTDVIEHDATRREAHLIAYQAIFLALRVADLFYPEGEHPPLELGKPLPVKSQEEYEDYIAKSANEYLLANPTIDNLIDKQLPRLDASGNHFYLASTAAAFVLDQIEQTNRKQYLDKKFFAIVGPNMADQN